MICIHCSYTNIDRLYYKYKSEYIKLTVCPNCGEIADKYIEFDNVLLFLDILLLKPRAYRHLAYNLTEMELLKDQTTTIAKNIASNTATSTNATNRNEIQNPSGSVFTQLKRCIKRYNQLLRLILLMVLFEVYLEWIYEEKKPRKTLMIQHVLQQAVHVQYIFMVLRLLIARAVQYSAIIFQFYKFQHWGSMINKNLSREYSRGYYNYVLLITLLLSSSLKLFPILMMIWPYDRTLQSATVINFMGTLNVIEALKIITQASYSFIFVAVVVSAVTQTLVLKFLLVTTISVTLNVPLKALIHSEYSSFLQNLQTYKDLVLSVKV